MALPSTNNATLEEMDDIWLEIPTEALHVFLGDTAEEVNLGAFWFEHESMFPVEENDNELLNSRVVAIDDGEDISGLTNHIKVKFLFQNASLILLHIAIPLYVSLRQRKMKQYAPVSTFHSSQYLCGSSASLSSSSVWLLTLLSRVGCGISLCFLCLALLIHLRRGKSDDSLCIHIHLCVALLCLNLTFLVNDSLASLGVHGLCVATAAATHYSLLCTLTWFSMEGFHLYLLIIRVFNIHVNRYLLKLSLVGWGIPGIVVTIIVACGKYGEYRIYQQDGGAVKMCWLTDSAVTTVSFSYFVLTFVVNTLCFGSVTVKVVRAHRQSPVLRERGMSRGTVLSLLGLAWLLGVSWGVMFFQFGPLRETAFYIFCTINSLHGEIRYSPYSHSHQVHTYSGLRTETVTSTLRDKAGAQDVNKHGGAQSPTAAVSVKTPKRDYVALVGALRRFGQCVQTGLLRSELSNRRRQPGEPLWVLANDIESISQRAYAHMHPSVQSELARDQFIQVLSSTELRIQTQLVHPESLEIALEMALAREPVWAGASVARNTRPGPMVCWGFGQPGHLNRNCPMSSRAQGNGSGSALAGMGEQGCVGDFCHVTVEGVPCSALVDTGSTVTLVRSDIVPGWTQFEPTTVQLSTVTGEMV
nr:unnamed protein product [Salmo salar]|eukprot:XP_014030248.1 PREDICTED: latrophilin-like protein LAT-2 [Salmo salar]